jgi:hypothetical protein
MLAPWCRLVPPAGQGRFDGLPTTRVPPFSSPSGTTASGPWNRVNRGKWKKALDVCKAAKLGGKRCLSANNPAGRACNADGTPMTEEQRQAAAIGARRGALGPRAPRLWVHDAWRELEGA